jgi:hypothetical protein
MRFDNGHTVSFFDAMGTFSVSGILANSKKKEAPSGILLSYDQFDETVKLFSVVLGSDDLLATVETGSGDVVTTMNFTGRSFDSNRGVGEEVVRTMVATLARGLLILLNSHLKPQIM